MQKTIQETFSLKDVPREAYNVGMAGVIPYMATSLSTVYCAWELNHAHATGSGFLMSDKTAELALHIIEPLQVGYGAVVSRCIGITVSRDLTSLDYLLPGRHTLGP